jgi:hypothetical protein
MSYFIEANIETNCEDRFPESMSYFFEQIGGYDEKSMVAQVESILKIDLSLFQHYDFPENPKPASLYWIEIKKMKALLKTLKSKIKANPDYYNEVKYNPVQAIWGISTDSIENARFKQAQVESEEHPMFGYPNDVGYLSSNTFLKDIYALEAILNCYSRKGATKVKLSYF